MVRAVDDAARFLRDTQLFSRMDDAAVDEIARRLVTRTFRRGEHLFHQGDAGEALYVIVDGSVAVVLTSESGDRMVLTTLGPADVLGEIALLDGQSRSASAEAVEETTTLMLSRAAFLDAVHGQPALVEELLRSLGGMVRRLSEQAGDFVFLTLPARLAKVLLRMAEDTGPVTDGVPVEIAVTQSRLAEMAGGSRQTVNQILKGFTERRWVEVQGRRILVCDPDQLRRRAGIRDHE